MRITTVVTAAVLAGVAGLPLAGVAAAQTNRDCRDFASQAAAQSALRSRSGDPERLDHDHNGVACEDYFKTAAGSMPAPVAPPAAVPVVEQPAPRAAAPVAPVAPVTEPVADGTPAGATVRTGAPADAVVRTVPEHQILVSPRGAADTGDGSTTPFEEAPVLLLAGALGAVAAVGGGYRLVRRSR